MAKKRTPKDIEEDRQTRKEVLRARKEAEQTRQIRVAVAVVFVLLALVFIVAIVNEFFIAPNRAVAEIGDQTIALGDWQERVTYERAQRIIFLEDQLEAFGGDVGIIQQFASQFIIELQDPEALGESTIEQMAFDIVACEALADRGITIGDAEVDKAVEESFNYFGGQSPTPAPEPTETIAPTPSLTPIPTEVITEGVEAPPAVPTVVLPTPEPQPTATPVSTEAFNEQYNDLMAQFKDYGVDEETYRTFIRGQLCRDQLMDVLAEEQELNTLAEQASIYYMAFETEEAAQSTQELIESGDFLTTWNIINSTPATEESVARASEILWRTEEDYASFFSEELTNDVFSLPLNTPSEIIAEVADDETTTYYIVMVSGREERELSESRIDNEKSQLLNNYISAELVDLVPNEFWRSRVPTQPVLDPKFLAAPTPAPLDPNAGGSGTGTE